MSLFCADEDVSSDNLGQIRQNQQQRGGEDNESCLAYFRVFKHGDLPFLLLFLNGDAP